MALSACLNPFLVRVGVGTDAHNRINQVTDSLNPFLVRVGVGTDWQGRTRNWTRLNPFLVRVGVGTQSPLTSILNWAS